MVSTDEDSRIGSYLLARIVLPERVHGPVLPRHVQALQVLLIPHSLNPTTTKYNWVFLEAMFSAFKSRNFESSMVVFSVVSV